MPPSLFPSILPTGEPFVDDTYGKAELERKVYQELRQIAAQVESDDIHGRMAKDELIDALEGVEWV